MAHVVCLKWHGVSYTRLNTSEKLLVLYFFNVAEQEPVEPKLFFESGAEKILNNIFCRRFQLSFNCMDVAGPPPLWMT